MQRETVSLSVHRRRREKTLARSDCEKNSLGNVTILPPRPRDDQTNFLNACDVAIIRLSEKARRLDAEQDLNTLAAGKPMIGIAEPTSELARVIEEEKVGWVVPPGSQSFYCKPFWKRKRRANASKRWGVARASRLRKNIRLPKP